MRLVEFICALTDYVSDLEFPPKQGSFFFVGVGFFFFFEVDRLVYSLNANMILNQFSKAGKQNSLC